jgi:hypothetical protein
MSSLELTESFYKLSEYLERSLQLKFIREGKNLDECSFSVLGKIKNYPILPGTRFCRDGTVTSEMSEDLLINYHEREQSTEIEIKGLSWSVKEAKELILMLYKPVPLQVKWVYENGGNYTRLPIRSDKLPRSEYYPQLTMPLEEYYTAYEESDSSILILIGPPGTGKTSFIRGMLHHSQSDAMISYDSDILKSDGIFVDFVTGGEKFMVLEDADTFLSSRSSSNNTMMHKFLNVGDGLMSTRGKKIVFSTNLPSTRDIDSALLRVGRCFDVLEFRKLTEEEAKRIAGHDFKSDRYPITLAEVFGGIKRTNGLANKMGF